jgi:hypothetical protein
MGERNEAKKSKDKDRSKDVSMSSIDSTFQGNKKNAAKGSKSKN